MKRFFPVTIALLIAILLVFGSCGDSATTSPSASQPAATTVASQPTTSSAPSTATQPGKTTPAADGQPVYGGTLRMITSGSFPKVLGLPEEFSPADSIYSLPVLERLNEWDEKGNLIPVLAESWEGDPEAMTITWHLRKGVKFHDGTDFNAEAVKWNYERGIAAGQLTDGQFIESLEIIDSHTLKMHLTKYTRMMFENYGWAQMTSPSAFESAGNGDEEKSKEWARANSCGTGPFKVVDFVRDTSIRYEKNPNYWREGMPYLDAIELRFIPDTMAAAATMEAKQADMWVDVSTVQDILDLEKKGLVNNWGPGMFWALLPNSSNPNSPTSKKAVREAIEYAIDRPSLANMIGQGTYEPLTQIAPQKFPGYVPGYDPRPYNPDKARQLLAEAGYPNGFKATIMATSTAQDAVTGIKAYLDAVGININVDIADLGRYFGELFGTGYTADLVFATSGINPDGTDLFVHFGPEPMTFRTGNIAKSQEYLALCEKALQTYDDAEAINIIKQAVKQAGEDAMIIPVYRSVTNAVMQPYVHSDYFLIHGVIWTSWDDWMEPH